MSRLGSACRPPGTWDRLSPVARDRPGVRCGCGCGLMMTAVAGGVKLCGLSPVAWDQPGAVFSVGHALRAAPEVLRLAVLPGREDGPAGCWAPSLRGPGGCEGGGR